MAAGQPAHSTRSKKSMNPKNVNPPPLSLSLAILFPHTVFTECKIPAIIQTIQVSDTKGCYKVCQVVGSLAREVQGEQRSKQEGGRGGGAGMQGEV